MTLHPSLRSSGNQTPPPPPPLFGEGDNGLRDLQSLKNLSFPHVGQEDDGGPTLLMEMLAKPGGDHGMNSGVESPPADSREAGEVFPFWEREWPVDGDPR